MKKYIPTIAQLTVFFGLPASFIAAAFHGITPHLASPASEMAAPSSALLVPFIFVAVVMSAALIVVHHLREEHRLAQFIHLHLRLSAFPKKSVGNLRKPRLATA